MDSLTAGPDTRSMADAVAERSGVRVLVVEDEEAILDFVEMGLRYEGFEVELTQDGPSALAAFERRRPDLIILDLNLPGMTGPMDTPGSSWRTPAAGSRLRSCPA